MQKHNKPKSQHDDMGIFIQAGELYFGNAPTVVSTILHSRTVITFWHPTTCIGGMCHVVKAEGAAGDQNMQYASCAISEFVRLANKYNTPLREYEVKVFGGVVKNEADARQHEITLDTICSLIKKDGFKLSQLYGFSASSQKIKLDLASGIVANREIGLSGTNLKADKQNNKPEGPVIEIFLHPGEIYFGRAPTIISTLLGSCVAVTLWHPRAHLGGMCHIVLPETPDGKCEMKYGDCAIAEFVKEATKHSTRTRDYIVNIYGGSDMFPGMQKSSGMRIGDRNIEKVKQLLELYDFNVNEVDIGGSNSRKIRLDLSNGSMGLRKHRKSADV